MQKSEGTEAGREGFGSPGGGKEECEECPPEVDEDIAEEASAVGEEELVEFVEGGDGEDAGTSECPCEDAAGKTDAARLEGQPPSAEEESAKDAIADDVSDFADDLMPGPPLVEGVGAVEEGEDSSERLEGVVRAHDGRRLKCDDRKPKGDGPPRVPTSYPEVSDGWLRATRHGSWELRG